MLGKIKINEIRNDRIRTYNTFKNLNMEKGESIIRLHQQDKELETIKILNRILEYNLNDIRPRPQPTPNDKCKYCGTILNNTKNKIKLYCGSSCMGKYRYHNNIKGHKDKLLERAKLSKERTKYLKSLKVEDLLKEIERGGVRKC